MDVNTANILPLIWASKFNLGLPNLTDPVPSMANSVPMINTNTNSCSNNMTRSNVAHNASNGANLWPAAAAAAALSNDFTTSFKQLLVNAAAANGMGPNFTQPHDTGEALFVASNHTTPTVNGFNGNTNVSSINSNSNGSNSNGPMSPNAGVTLNGLNLQQALMARLGQAAAASIMGDKQNQQQQSANFSMHSGHQLSNNKLMHLMPNYGNASSPGK